MNKEIIFPTEFADNGLEKMTSQYYSNRVNGKATGGEHVGFLIKGIDVGKARYSDIHLDYPVYELASEEIEQKDFDLGGYRVRWFHPLSITSSAPTIFFIHGGGYITGTIDRYDKMNRRLAELIHGIVVHVDYTLSPETGYPTALEQSYHAIEYMVAHADEYLINPDKVAIMGDSAGGNCCAALPLRDRTTKYIKKNFLYYPLVDFSSHSADVFDISRYGENLSEIAYKRTMSLKDGTSVCKTVFLQNGEDDTDELISPLLAKDLSGYPSTVVICADFDFLTQQSEEFAERLEQAGTPVCLYMFKGTFHGFLDRLGYFEASDKSLRIVAEHMKTL